MKLATLVLAAILALTGCATTPDPARNSLVNAGAVLVLGDYIRKAGDTAAQIQRAERIRNTATAIRAVASGELVTLEQLANEVRARYPAGWLPHERAAADELLLALSALIGTKVGGTELLPTDLTRVTSLCDAVLRATAYYTG